MPSLQCVVVHDGYSNLVWASDEVSLAEEPEVVTDAIANALADTAEFAGVMRTLDADRVVYSFALRGEQIDLLGVVSLIGRLPGQAEARPLKYVQQLVQPALECLRRELSLRSQLGSREHALGGLNRASTPITRSDGCRTGHARILYGAATLLATLEMRFTTMVRCCSCIQASKCCCARLSASGDMG